MKKLLGATVLMLVSVASCDKKGEDVTLTPEEQKVEMETIASALMKEFAATEFEDVMQTMSDLYLSCEDSFSEDYDWSALEDAYEERLRAAYSYEELDGYTELCTYRLLFSTISGEITLGKNAATYKPADNTVVVYTDDNGDKWTAELTPVGTVKETYLGNFVSYSEDLIWDDNYGYARSVTYEEQNEITVAVPEKLVMSLKKNGENYLTSTTTFDLSISSTGVDVKKDKISITETIEVQGLKVVLEKSSYDAVSGKLAQSVSFSKDGKFICSVKTSAEGKVDVDAEEWSAKNINVEIDILGQMQIKGTCPDAKSIANLMDNADPQSAKDWDRIINNVNTKFNLNVYFNGGSTSQAIINLESRWDDYDYGYGWAEPAIEFNDGSRYLLYEYFTEENFSETVENAESFAEKYERLIDRYFGFLS